MPSLVRAPVPYASLFYRVGPHRFANWLIPGPALERARILKHLLPARKVSSFCAFNAAIAGPSSFTARRPAAVFGISAAPFEAWVIALVIITSPRIKSTSPQSKATSSLVRSLVHKVNCTKLAACAVSAAMIALCSSGLNGSTSSSSVRAAFRL